MKDRANKLYAQVMQAAGTAQQIPAQYAQLRADADDLKKNAERYLTAQITLQFIATAAMVGMFYLTYKAAKRRS